MEDETLSKLERAKYSIKAIHANTTNEHIRGVSEQTLALIEEAITDRVLYNEIGDRKFNIGSTLRSLQVQAAKEANSNSALRIGAPDGPLIDGPSANRFHRINAKEIMDRFDALLPSYNELEIELAKQRGQMDKSCSIAIEAVNRFWETLDQTATGA